MYQNTRKHPWLLLQSERAKGRSWLVRSHSWLVILVANPSGQILSIVELDTNPECVGLDTNPVWDSGCKFPKEGAAASGTLGSVQREREREELSTTKAEGFSAPHAAIRCKELFWQLPAKCGVSLMVKYLLNLNLNFMFTQE